MSGWEFDPDNPKPYPDEWFDGDPSMFGPDSRPRYSPDFDENMAEYMKQMAKIARQARGEPEPEDAVEDA